MKKRLLKLLSIVLCALFLSSLGVTVFAEETQEEEIVIYDVGTEGILDCPDFPESYKKRSSIPEHVEQVTYDNGIGMKYFNVYLPNGYEENDADYNVLYLLHGGGCNPESYFRTDQPNSVSKVFDHMFEDNIMDPFIIVSASWYPTNDEELLDSMDSDERDYRLTFVQEELPNFIIPYIDEHYRTIPGREHRAIGGFSAGSSTTWMVLMYDMKDFATFIPMSGDCWVIEQMGGSTKPVETANAIADAITAQGYTADDFRIFAATSPADFAYPNLAPQMIAMKDNDMFRFGENTFFALKDGIVHGDPNSRHYLYVILPLIW